MEEQLIAPTLQSPEDGARADDAEVLFQWNPVERAVGYRLQVARDEAFDEIIFSTRVGTRDALLVGGVLPRDDSRLFWRVLARTEAGEDLASDVRSFISARQENDSTPTAAREGQRHDAIVGVDRSRGSTPAYEFWIFALALATSLVLVFVAAWQLTGIVPSAEPELAEEEVMQEEFDAVIGLDEYEAVDEGVFRIPMDRAIELMLEEYDAETPAEAEPE